MRKSEPKTQNVGGFYGLLERGKCELNNIGMLVSKENRQRKGNLSENLTIAKNMVTLTVG